MFKIRQDRHGIQKNVKMIHKLGVTFYLFFYISKDKYQIFHHTLHPAQKNEYVGISKKNLCPSMEFPDFLKSGFNFDMARIYLLNDEKHSERQ